MLLDRPFAALTVGEVMARAGLTRTVFYRHFDRLAQMAPELLPDAEDPLLDQLVRGPAEDLITAMVAGLVQMRQRSVGRRALDAAAAADPTVSTELDRVVGPRQLLQQLVANAPHPPANPPEFATTTATTAHTCSTHSAAATTPSDARQRYGRADRALGPTPGRVIRPRSLTRLLSRSARRASLCPNRRDSLRAPLTGYLQPRREQGGGDGVLKRRGSIGARRWPQSRVWRNMRGMSASVCTRAAAMP